MGLIDEQSPEGSELVDAAKLLHQPKVASGHQRSVGRGDREVDSRPALRAPEGSRMVHMMRRSCS
jgi:hypothetical protein